MWVDVGRCGSMWDHLARDPLRRLVVAEERSGTLGGGLDVVAVRGEAAPAPQAHRTAPYRPRYSLDQRTAGQYRWRARYPRRGMYLLGRRAPRRDQAQGLLGYKSEPHSLPGAGQGRPRPGRTGDVPARGCHPGWQPHPSLRHTGQWDGVGSITQAVRRRAGTRTR